MWLCTCIRHRYSALSAMGGGNVSRQRSYSRLGFKKQTRGMGYRNLRNLWMDTKTVLPRRTPSSDWAESTRSPSPASTTGRTRRTCSSNRSASARTSATRQINFVNFLRRKKCSTDYKKSFLWKIYLFCFSSAKTWESFFLTKKNEFSCINIQFS